MTLRTSLMLVPILAGCGSVPMTETETETETENDVQAGVPAEPISLQGWAPERIALPPEFAPALPAGSEVLLFAPGMFTAGTEDFWSYVFLMEVEETGIGAQRLTEILELYYDGLIQSVAASRGSSLGDDAATVRLHAVGGDQYEARIEMIDAFVTMEPLDLHVKIRASAADGGRTRLDVKASPQPYEHEIWRRLTAALASLEL